MGRINTQGFKPNKKKAASEKKCEHPQGQPKWVGGERKKRENIPEKKQKDVERRKEKILK